MFDPRQPSGLSPQPPTAVDEDLAANYRRTGARTAVRGAPSRGAWTTPEIAEMLTIKRKERAMCGRTARRLLAFALVAALAAWGGVASAQTVRAVMHAEVKFLDPHSTTADITQVHGYMVYDTLFSLDAKGQPQPQMVNTYQISSDKL